jgi:iron complex outermembrane recepter protein
MLISMLMLAASAAGVADDADKVAAERQPIEEIVVTAQKRAQNLQDVPAAVTAIDAQTLELRGTTTLADVQNLVPSVRMQKESASTEIYIRGVGSTLDVPMIEPPNAYNINGIYVPREVTSASLVDVERIEVLPGPQGTLYGRGAIGGVVNTVTRRPGDDEETRVLVEAGDYSHARAAVTQNLPLGERAALRGTLSYFDRDGYLASGADSEDDLAGFISLFAAPTDAVDLFLWTQIERRKGYAANLVSKGSVGNPRSQAFPTGDPWEDQLIGDLAPYATLGPIDAQGRDWNSVLVGGELSWHISDALTMIWLPSWLNFDWHQGYWLTHKNGDFNESIDQQTHELRFAFDDGGAVSWLAGAYLYRIETSGQLFIQFGPDELFPGSPPGLWLDAVDVRRHRLEGAALFGELTYSVSDRARLIAGARASRDRRIGAGFQPDIVVEPAIHTDPVALFTGAAPPGYSNRKSWDHLDWKLGAEFDVSEDSMLYATLQTGFQPGTFDLFPDTTTRESQLFAVTVGAKNRFLGGQLLLNNEIFHYRYDKLLTQAFDAATGTNRLTNADVTIYGDQLDLALAPDTTPDTRFTLSIGYLHARYDDFLVDELDVYNGTQMQNAPDWTVTLGISHDWLLGSGARIRADLGSRYEGGFWGDFSHSSGIYQAAYTKTDLSLTWYPQNNRWSAGLWVKNLENQDVQAAAATGNPLTDPGPGAPFLEPPRTYGLRFALQLGGG